MKLVETDADRPDDEVEPPPVATPPRPEKRAAYASLIFTTAVLIGTVATIYSVFPARKNETINAALRAHRADAPSWQLERPARAELAAWATGVLVDAPPLPALDAVGARRLDVRHRAGIYVRFDVDGARVSYVVQHAGDAPADRTERRDGDELVEAWHSGAWTVIAIGPAARADAWKPRVGVP